MVFRNDKDGKNPGTSIITLSFGTKSKWIKNCRRSIIAQLKEL
jgi:hypothetical protein